MVDKSKFPLRAIPNVRSEADLSNWLLQLRSLLLDWMAKLQPVIDGDEMSAMNLTDLGDVTLTSPASPEVVQYNGTQWVNAQLDYSDLSGSIGLDDLSDVNIGTPAVNRVLQHNGTEWVDSLLLLSELGDVAVPGPSTGQILTFTGFFWQNQDPVTAGFIVQEPANNADNRIHPSSAVLNLSLRAGDATDHTLFQVENNAGQERFSLIQQDSATRVEARFLSGTGVYVGFKLPSGYSGADTYQLPTDLPSSSGQALTSTTGGVMSWATVSSMIDVTANYDWTGRHTYENATPFRLLNGSKLGFDDGTDEHTFAQPTGGFSASVDYSLPPDAGSDGGVLTTDGLGKLTWRDPAGSFVLLEPVGSQTMALTTGSEFIIEIAPLTTTPGLVVQFTNGEEAFSVGKSAIIVGTTNTNPNRLEFREDTDNGTNRVSLKAPDSIAADLDLVLPNADGAAGTPLTTDGAGNLSLVASNHNINNHGDVSVSSPVEHDQLTYDQTAGSWTNRPVYGHRTMEFRASHATGVGANRRGAVDSADSDLYWVVPTGKKFLVLEAWGALETGASATGTYTLHVMCFSPGGTNTSVASDTHTADSTNTRLRPTAQGTPASPLHTVAAGDGVQAGWMNDATSPDAMNSTNHYAAISGILVDA